MNPIDATKIDATNRILQQIKAENGPTPLVFTLVKLKTLCFELLQTSLDNPYLRQLYETLQHIS
ncbi:hypothetical protein [Spirosoma validum]|uniref:Uncharacterized protein n=1 Tax=Spirosoma validum TaxID=2771355 RepID=A0A927B7E7_9BACT|nr:hypothetical protein [Spirosoma validum]MBD2757101.1 hypothetical protein [Spirosoma validum]